MTEAVPRSMTRSTSPVLRPRCQRRLRVCRCEKSPTCKKWQATALSQMSCNHCNSARSQIIFWSLVTSLSPILHQHNYQHKIKLATQLPTWISLVVYCWTLIHRKVLSWLSMPCPPVPPPCTNLRATKTRIKSQQKRDSVGRDSRCEGVRESTEKIVKPFYNSANSEI